MPLVALFETAFYQFAPEAMMRYAVPESWHETGVRRWGFHGASHKFIAERSAELLGRDDVAERARRLYVDGGTSPVARPDLRVISCHLGGSSSVTGILNGVAIGNSLGMSPQSGLPHNNRVGDLDSAAVPFAMRTLGLSLEEAERQLTKESGLKGLSGRLERHARHRRRGSARATRGPASRSTCSSASARHWIGAYFFALNGADAIVFTAGIGENSASLRASNLRQPRSAGHRARRGAECADHRARRRHQQRRTSPVKVLVIPTNEELVVAREATTVAISLEGHEAHEFWEELVRPRKSASCPS